jgi:hypothetical protein
MLADCFMNTAHLDSRIHNVLLRVVGLQDYRACAVEHVVGTTADISSN